MARVHIGKKIREVVDKSHIKVTDFATSINLSRDAVYKIFAKAHLDTELLSQISKSLNHDFFAYYSSTVALKDVPNNYGYATKDEVESLSQVVQQLAVEVKKLREELPQKKASKKKKQKG